jgi:4-coumarate--CoA ligase
MAVSPAELEDVLLAHPDIVDAAVIGVNDTAQETELPRCVLFFPRPLPALTCLFAVCPSSTCDECLFPRGFAYLLIFRAYIVRKPDAPPLSVTAIERDVQAFVAARAARHKQLRGGVVTVDVIPKSASGKILRRELRERARAERADAKAKL